VTRQAAHVLRACLRCPRLVQNHVEVRAQYPDYHAAPVGSWGDPNPRIVIVGLAPGLHGATRTGKAFVGDASSRFLFAALYRQGLATSQLAEEAQLQRVRITNVVKCLPPGNAPIAAEIAACTDHLVNELNRYFPYKARRPRVLVTLGGIAHNAVCRQLKLNQAKFGHANIHKLTEQLHIISSYHPSRLNVNTGRLTEQMFDEVLCAAKRLAVD